MKRRLVLFAALLVGAVAQAAEYARPELLIEPSELATLLADSRTMAPDGKMVMVSGRVVLLDVRSEASYLSGCLPWAQWIDIGDWKAAFGDGLDTAAWTQRLSGIAPGDDGVVVVYDNAVTPSAARAWWILKYWGVDEVRLLNGGVDAWLADGQELATPTVPMSQPGDFVAKPQPERHATREEVLAIAGGAAAATCLIDTRSDREVGAGVVPAAGHAEWTRFVNPETGKMRPADELQELLDGVGFDPQQPAVLYCRSGGRASVVALAMELMGGERVANYHGSWNDWTRDPSAPVVELGEGAR